MKKQPLQPGSPEKPQEQSEQPSKKGRNVFLGLGAVAAAVLAVMLATKHEDAPKETPEKAPTPVTKELPLPKPPQQSSQPKLESPEIPVDSSIPVPTCEIVADSSSSKMPKNLRMTQDEFIILSDRIASIMTANIKERLVPYLKEHPQELQDVLRQAIQQAAGAIEMADPRAQEEMMSFNQVWSQNPDPVKLVAHINEYLEPSGWYFDCRVTENAELYLEYFPVQQRKKVVIKDGSSVSHEIPVRYLGKPVINHPSYASETGPVSASADLASVNVLTGHLNERKEYIEDMLVSAATSVFLSRKFPKAATMLERGKRFYVPISVKAGDGNIASLEGFYPPIMFHMIAGTGLQLANSHRSAPDLHALYLQDPKALAREQGLMAKMLPIATLQAAPDSPAKQELIQIFQSQGAINFEKLKALMFAPPYTMEHSRKAGEVLYRAGYMAFEAIEKGQFTQVGQ